MLLSTNRLLLVSLLALVNAGEHKHQREEGREESQSPKQSQQASYQQYLDEYAGGSSDYSKYMSSYGGASADYSKYFEKYTQSAHEKPASQPLELISTDQSAKGGESGYQHFIPGDYQHFMNSGKHGQGGGSPGNGYSQYIPAFGAQPIELLSTSSDQSNGAVGKAQPVSLAQSGYDHFIPGGGYQHFMSQGSSSKAKDDKTSMGDEQKDTDKHTAKDDRAIPEQDHYTSYMSKYLPPGDSEYTDKWTGDKASFRNYMNKYSSGPANYTKYTSKFGGDKADYSKYVDRYSSMAGKNPSSGDGWQDKQKEQKDAFGKGMDETFSDYIPGDYQKMAQKGADGHVDDNATDSADSSKQAAPAAFLAESGSSRLDHQGLMLFLMAVASVSLFAIQRLRMRRQIRQVELPFTALG